MHASTQAIRETLSVDSVLRDLRHALRGLSRRPGFTLVAVLSLALGIGANTGVFSLVNAVLLRPLPVERPDELVEVYTGDSDGYPYATSSWPDVVDLREATGDVFQAVAAYELFVTTTERDAQPVVLMGEAVSRNYFELLGVRPALGRAFAPDEGVVAGEDRVALVGHAFWQREMGGDPEAVGATIRLNRRPLTVIGVLPEDFHGMIPALVPDVWVPVTLMDEISPGASSFTEARGNRGLFVKARLRPGVTVERAGEVVEAVASRLAEAYPDTNEGRTMSVLPSEGVSIHPMVDRALVPVAGLLLSVVGIVLLITCANLASFLLARAEDRRRDVAVRRALGAGRWSVVRPFVAETALLALGGGASGVLLARWMVGGLMRFKPPLPIPVNIDVGLDARVLLFAFGVTGLAALAFGLIPAIRATGREVAATLQEGRTPEGTGPGGGRLRRGLVVVQVALSCVLLVGAGLFLRSLRQAHSVDPGFDTGPAGILWPNLSLSGIPDAEGEALWPEIERRMRADGAIDRVGLADVLPLGAGVQTTGIGVPGHESDRPDGRVEIDHANVSAGYFDVMDIPIVRGRGFEPSDAAAGSGSVIVSRAFQERFFPDGAVGRSLDGGALTVVGVAEDTKVRTLGEAPRPRIYFPLGSRGYIEAVNVVVRGPGTGPELLAAARRVLDQVRPGIVVFEAKTMRQHLGLMLFGPRMAALLLGALGGLALLLASVGLYGVVSYAVVRRTREMGIRLSLGASPSDVLTLVVTGGMRMVVMGAGIGVVLALLAGGALSSFLIGVSGRDTATLVAIPAILLAVGFLASWIPARRAVRLDPSEVLRSE